MKKYLFETTKGVVEMTALNYREAIENMAIMGHEIVAMIGCYERVKVLVNDIELSTNHDFTHDSEFEIEMRHGADIETEVLEMLYENIGIDAPDWVDYHIAHVDYTIERKDVHV